MAGIVLPDPSAWDPDDDLVGASRELTPEMALGGYASGVFPMPLREFEGSPIGWFSPVERAVLPLDGLVVRRSLRKTAKHYTTTCDAAFEAVVRRCADPRRDGAWIDDRILATYLALHHRGAAHSVETWNAEGELVGGLYGVGVGGLFAGESMFHDPERGRDASKVALMRLVEVLAADGVERLLDVQWATDHLLSLGVVEWHRDLYLARLAEAVRLPEPSWPSGQRAQ